MAIRITKEILPFQWIASSHVVGREPVPHSWVDFTQSALLRNLDFRIGQLTGGEIKV